MKKIVYLNTAIGTANFGDYIINESIRKEMHYLNKDAFVYELPSHTKLFGLTQKLFAKKAIKAFNDVDYKFLNGTNALYTTMLRPNPNWKISLFDRPCAKDVILLGVGLGVNSKKSDLYTKALWKKVLRKDVVHSVRDEVTKDYLEDLGFRAEYTCCPTTWRFTPEFLSDVPSEKSDSAVLMLTNYLGDEAFDKAMIDAVCDMYDKVYFVPQTFGDNGYFDRIVTPEQRNKIVRVGGNIASYDDLLSSNNIDYIGNRLHGAMYALQHKRRTIVFSIDYRAKNMLKDANFCYARNEENRAKLKDILSSPFAPSIELPSEAINKWKAQFN